MSDYKSLEVAVDTLEKTVAEKEALIEHLLAELSSTDHYAERIARANDRLHFAGTKKPGNHCHGPTPPTPCGHNHEVDAVLEKVPCLIRGLTKIDMPMSNTLADLLASLDETCSREWILGVLANIDRHEKCHPKPHKMPFCF